ncbi:MAG: molybdenum cofactor biosynthesis protein MoaE [Pseudomonadota bacterium]
MADRVIETRVQTAPFDAGAECAALVRDGIVGAVVSFTGHVRGSAGDVLELQHYPGMTEGQIAAIADEAARRWDLTGGLVIHRHGPLPVGAPIVLVAVASRHRGDAFRAAEFLIDWLKVKAPFWKKEGDRWVEAQAADDAAAAGWQ